MGGGGLPIGGGFGGQSSGFSESQSSSVRQSQFHNNEGFGGTKRSATAYQIRFKAPQHNRSFRWLRTTTTLDKRNWYFALWALVVVDHHVYVVSFCAHV